MDTQNFGARLRLLLELKRKTVTSLALHCGITPQAAQQWTKGRTIPRGPKLDQIATFLGMTTQELLYGRLGDDGKVAVDSNVEPVTSRRPDVPLISFVQAGSWLEATDPYNVGDAEEWLPCPVSHGPRTYALRIRGESMCNPGGPLSFCDGDIIFCDPDRVVNHKSLVIARLDDSKEATFKRLLIDDSKHYLEALNPAWPNRIFEIDENATICGIVIARLETFV